MTSYANIRRLAALMLAGVGAYACTDREPADATDVHITAHVLDETGVPLKAAVLEAAMYERTGERVNVWLVPVVDDAPGVVRLTWPEAAANAELRLILSARHDLVGMELDVSRLAGANNDLGSVQLAPPPILVAGRVVGPDGKPVVHCSVFLERRWMSPLDDPSAWNMVVGRGLDNTNDAGQFQLRGWAGTDVLRVVAREHGFAKKTCEVRAGDMAIELHLIASGGVLGHVHVDAACGPFALAIDCSPAGQPRTTGASASPNGDFSILNLDPGSYDVRFRASNDEEPLVSVLGIAVRSGEQTRDHRLQSIDLRGKIHCWHVKVERPTNDDDSWFYVLVRQPSDDEFRGASSASGDFELATSRASLDVRIDAPGYRTVRLDALDSDRTVVLVKGLAVRATIHHSPLPEGWVLVADLAPRVSEFTRHGARNIAVDARGEVLLRASDPGVHVVRILVRRIANGQDFWLRDIASPAIDVAESSAETVVSISIDAQELQKVIDEITREH